MFIAYLSLSTENLWLSPQGEYEGGDPDTRIDQGIVRTLEAKTLKDLKTKIESEFVSLKQWDEFEGRLEWSCDGEHDYRTPKEEQIPFTEYWELIIVERTETLVPADRLLALK